MKISVIVPVYNAENIIKKLIDSLQKQTFSDFNNNSESNDNCNCNCNCNCNFEVIFVDDCSTDNSVKIIKQFNYKLISLPQNKGPAYCRNMGAKIAQGELLVFTDSDCIVEKEWLNNIYKIFADNSVQAIMGKLILAPSTVMGDSISALGFPAGGSVGFENIWKVDANGYTDSLSTCNCAVLKEVFQSVGGFDTLFPFPGGEDSLLAYHIRKKGYKIKYCPTVKVHHAARDSFKDFIKWQFRRGISSYIFSTKVEQKQDFLSLRIWSTKNIIKNSYKDKKFPLIMVLFKISFAAQFAGFIFGKYLRK